MALRIFNEVDSFRFSNKRKTIEWFKVILELFQKKAGNISVIFCKDDRLLEINETFLKHFYFTDVITFNYNSDDVISGDIFISIDRVKENAVKYKVDISVELNRVMVHGLLHLLGYDDKTKTDRNIMRNMENKLLTMLSE